MSKRQQELFPELIHSKKYVCDIDRLVAEWHPEKNSSKRPEDFLAQSNKSVWWKCSKGHEWKAAIYSRSSGRNCPYCSGKLPSETYNLQFNFPEIAAEWHEENQHSPREFTPFSNKKALWKCERGHEWSTGIAHRTVSGNGCPKCSNQSSKNEIRILTELKAAFGEVFSRHKICGHEVDVYIPSIGTAI
jgi:hypothetical protein